MVFIRLPVTVANRLSARQSEIFTEFRLKSSFDGQMRSCVRGQEISNFQLQCLNLTFKRKIDRFHCHAITNYIENHTVDKSRKGEIIENK